MAPERPIGILVMLRFRYVSRPRSVQSLSSDYKRGILVLLHLRSVRIPLPDQHPQPLHPSQTLSAGVVVLKCNLVRNPLRASWQNNAPIYHIAKFYPTESHCTCLPPKWLGTYDTDDTHDTDDTYGTDDTLIVSSQFATLVSARRGRTHRLER